MWHFIFWLIANKLTLNTVKTEFMVIGSSQRVGQVDVALETTPHALFVKDASIGRVKQVKNLGLITDENLTWDNHHINYISRRMKRNLSILKRISKILPTESLCMLYKTLSEPHIRYCSIVWGNCDEALKDKLQILQNKAARMITRTTNDITNHFALLRQLKWLDVRSIIKLEMGLFMYKAMNQLVSEQISEMFTPLSTHHSYQTRSVANGNLHIPTSHLFTEQRSLSYAGSSFGMKFHLKSEMLIH